MKVGKDNRGFYNLTGKVRMTTLTRQRHSQFSFVSGATPKRHVYVFDNSHSPLFFEVLHSSSFRISAFFFGSLPSVCLLHNFSKKTYSNAIQPTMSRNYSSRCICQPPHCSRLPYRESPLLTPPTQGVITVPTCFRSLGLEGCG